MGKQSWPKAQKPIESNFYKSRFAGLRKKAGRERRHPRCAVMLFKPPGFRTKAEASLAGDQTLRGCKEQMERQPQVATGQLRSRGGGQRLHSCIRTRRDL